MELEKILVENTVFSLLNLSLSTLLSIFMNKEELKNMLILLTHNIHLQLQLHALGRYSTYATAS